MRPHVTVLLYADVGHGYGRGILRGIADYAKVHGGWDFDFQSIIQPGFTSTFAEKKINGVIIQARTMAEAEELQKSAMPAVNIFNSLDPSVKLPAVYPDDGAIGRMAAGYFLDRGFQHFAFFSDPTHRFSRKRGQAFIPAIEAAGFTCAIVPKTPERLALLQSLPKPLAVFCPDDASAKATVKQCLQLGLNVPDQVAVLGVDNDEIQCELSGVRLSSIRLATDKIGYEAASLLAKLIAGQPAPPGPILIPPVEVITRRSTDILALADTEVAAVVRFIRDRGGRQINVQDLLRQTSLSRRSLEMRFRKALGRSPWEEIRRVQIERAQALLTGTDRPVREIADACGFKEPRQLSMAFHDRIGLTPRQYRRKSRQMQAGEKPKPAAVHKTIGNL